MRKFSIILIPLALLFLFSLIGTSEESSTKIPAPADLTPESHYPQIAKRIAENMPISHLSRAAFDDEISQTALDAFLTSMDYDRTLFLWDDVKKYRANRLKLDDLVKSGSTDFAFDVFETYRERLSNRCAYVETLLDKGFDNTVNEVYQYKRKKAPWPKTETEWDELWRKKIKNEYISAEVSRALEQEAADEKRAKAKDGEATEDEKEEETPPSIEENIRKRYRSILTNVNQHDAEYVIQLYLNSFTHAYDAHSAYMSPRNFEDFNINIGLVLTGIGAQLTVEDGAAKISSVIKGGPADQDGRLQKNDKIIGVGQGDEEMVDIMYWPLYKSVRLIRGPKGTTVVLKVIPADDPGKVVNIEILRDEVKLEEGAAKAKIEEIDDGKGRKFKLGYLDLPDFYEDMRRMQLGAPPPRSSARDVRNLLNDLNKKEVDGLVFDLRNNGGGSLRAAVEMSGLFINRGPIVQVKDNSGVRPLNDPDPRQIFTKPVVVLVNRHSASASEILAAALQDYGRAIIIGDSKTHGKGSVQSLFPLERNNDKLGSFKVTTAGFFRIDGKSTQLKGVTPDIILPSPLDNLDVGEEFLDNVLPWSKVDSARYEPVGNLAAAIGALKEKSDKRRGDDTDYCDYEDMMKEHKKRQEREEVTLNFEQRLNLVRDDRALNKLQRQYGRQDVWEKDDADEKDDEDTAGKDDQEAAEVEKPGVDLVLEESFQILKDLITTIEEQKLLIEGGA